MTDLASNSIYLPPPSISTTRWESNQYRSTHRIPRSGSRSTVRRSRHVQQASPFTSPILEDEDALPSIGVSGSALGAAGGITYSILEKGRHHGAQMSHRAPFDNGSAVSQPRQHTQHTGLHNAAIPITEESPLNEEDDVDPYIRPDEGRESKMDGHPSSEITGVSG